jgi:hypothetical protein
MSCIKLLNTKIWLGFCLIFILSIAGGAQSITGSISGIVTDPNGGLIPGATVTIINEQNGSTRNAVTDDEGRFQFSTLQPGPYTVKIENQGFQTLQRTNTVLTANENLALGEIKLTAGNVSEVVTVVGSGATVELESSDLTARLTADQIDLISTKGRDITSLLRLIPGTTNENDVEGLGEGFGTDLPFVSGQRGRSTVPTIDGLNAGEPSGSNKLSMAINQDAIAEVKILRNNYAAEYGNNGGAIINLVSKGGGKDYRGSAYYFLRNEALNANQYFNNKVGLPRPLYRHNYPGFNFGGPLPIPRFGETDTLFIKNKAFFFFSYEKPHQISPTNPIFITVPTALERMGDFSQSFTSSGRAFITDPLLAQMGKVCTALTGVNSEGCFRDPTRATAANPLGLNIIPLNRFNQSTAAFLRVFPMPNASAFGTNGIPLYNFITQKSVDVPKRSMVIRFDVKPTENDSIFWKRQWWTSDNLGLGTSGWPSGDQNRWGLLSHYLYKDNGWSANWTHIFSKSIVNEFSFGMRHDSEGFIPGDGIADLVSRSALNYTTPQLFPVNNRLGAIPKVTNFGGAPGTPALINWLDRWGETGNDYVQPSFADNVSYIRGNHSMKFGMYFERLLNGEAAGSLWAGQLSFTNSTSGGWTAALGNTGHPYANALLGNFQQYQETQFRPHTNIEQDMVQWYAQDQWKINRRLSLNYGVRFGWHTPFYQRDRIGSSFDPSLWDPSSLPRFYVPWCRLPGNVPSPTWTDAAACPTANRVGVDPALIVNGVLPAGAPTVNQNLVRTFVPGSGNILNGLQLARDPNTPKGYRIFDDQIDWEPRVGFAYDLTGKSRTVIRGMFGVYHTPRAGGGTTGDLTGNPPEQRTWTLTNGNIDNLQALLNQLLANDLVFPWGSVRGLEKQTHTPEIYNFSFGVQQDLGWGTVIEASYVGSRARWLGEQRDINQQPDGARLVNCNILPAGVPCNTRGRDPFTALSDTNPTTGALNDDFLRPFFGYGDAINFVTFSGTSRYDSLQVQVNRRYSAGLQYGVAYTWSKASDATSDDRDGLDFSTGTLFGRDYRKFNYTAADFDQRHVFTVNYIWDVPLFKKGGNRFLRAILGGWQLSGTTSFATGKPKDVTVTYSSTSVTISSGQTCPVGSYRSAAGTQCTPITDFTGGSNNSNPFVTCDATNISGVRDSQGTPVFLNVDCFSRPTRIGEIGDNIRNVARRPSIFNTDIALFKNFRWGERRGIQLRWETYNIFNRTNFSDLDAALTYSLVQINPGAIANPGLPPPACSATNICTAEFRQTNDRFGAAIAARSPRIMQASIRINF